MKLSACLLLGLSVLVVTGCVDQNEKRAEELFQRAQQHQDRREYEKQKEILQRITIDYDQTKTAERAALDIAHIEEMQKIVVVSQNKQLNRIFERIAHGVETHKLIFSKIPTTKDEVGELEANKELDWFDPWGNPIRYRAYYNKGDETPDEEGPDGYVLASFGRDGLPGGSGWDKDYFYYNKQTVEILDMLR